MIFLNTMFTAQERTHYTAGRVSIPLFFNPYYRPDYDPFVGGVDINLKTGIGTGGGFTDYYFGFEGVRGTDFDDIIHGDKSDNQITGGSGSDFLYGEGGNDVLYSGGGEVFPPSTSENDTLFGGAGGDTLVLNSYLGHLFGGKGNDELQTSGGIKPAIYTGGDGADLFYVGGTAVAPIFTVTDFEQGVDKIATGYIRSQDDIDDLIYFRGGSGGDASAQVAYNYQSPYTGIFQLVFLVTLEGFDQTLTFADFEIA